MIPLSLPFLIRGGGGGGGGGYSDCLIDDVSRLFLFLKNLDEP